MHEFGELLGGAIRGGIIAIATNGEAEAHQWALPLNLFCVMNRIIDDAGNRPNFQVVKLANKNTWIVWW